MTRVPGSASSVMVYYWVLPHCHSIVCWSCCSDLRPSRKSQIKTCICCLHNCGKSSEYCYTLCNAQGSFGIIYLLRLFSSKLL
ncbi:hypothetical protein EJB05_57748, partial [Eragrostis curvula]